MESSFMKPYSCYYRHLRLIVQLLLVFYCLDFMTCFSFVIKNNPTHSRTYKTTSTLTSTSTSTSLCLVKGDSSPRRNNSRSETTSIATAAAANISLDHTAVQETTGSNNEFVGRKLIHWRWVKSIFCLLSCVCFDIKYW